MPRAGVGQGHQQVVFPATPAGVLAGRDTKIRVVSPDIGGGDTGYAYRATKEANPVAGRRPVGMATVVGTWKNAPRPPGATIVRRVRVRELHLGPYETV